MSTYSLKKSDVIRINYNNGDIQSFGANERIIITKVNQDRDDENDFLKGKQNNNRSYNDQFSILSFGYGLPGSSFTDAEANLYGLKDPQWKHLGPFYIQYEHAITESIGIGLNISYIHYEYFENTVNLEDNEERKYHRGNIGLRGWYHFNKLINAKNLDIYIGGGFDVSHRIFNINSPFSYSITTNKFIPVIRCGLRYYLGPIGFFGEIGYDQMSILHGGISFALKK